MKCTRCGKENPAEIHTCTPLALRLAVYFETVPLGSDLDDLKGSQAAAELRRLHAENESLRASLHGKHELEKLNAELVEALDRLVKRDEADGMKYSGDHPVAQARAALKKAKEQT